MTGLGRALAVGGAPHRRASVLAATVWLVGAAGFAGALVLAARNGPLATLAHDRLASLVLVGSFTCFGVVGALVAWRRPANAIGWLFLSVFTGIAVLIYAQEHATYTLAVAPGTLPGGVLAAWVAGWLWFTVLGLMLIFVPLLFPTGRLPSPRWRVVSWGGGIATVAVTVHSAVAERLASDGYAVDNPVGLPGVVGEQGLLFDVSGGVLVAAMLAAAASLVVRFRRSVGDERQQLKWFTLAAAVLALAVLADVAGLPMSESAGDVLFGLAVGCLPVAAGLAVLRYRLYDIDRIISRTVSYALLTGVLLTVYAAGVVVVGNLLAPLGTGGDLPVAGATLGAAALFAPARRQIQARVDRRFNRARYDAQREVESFRARLRTGTDLAELAEAVEHALDGTVQPASASLWLRPATRRP